MNKSEIKNSADMFLYKAIVDLNSAKYLLEAFNEDKIDIDCQATFKNDHLRQIKMTSLV